MLSYGADFEKVSNKRLELTALGVLGSIGQTQEVEAITMEILVAVHNIMRWVVVILAIVALVRAYRGWLGRREWAPVDKRISTFFGAAMDTQMLLGIILWIFGNWGLKAFAIPVAEGASRIGLLFFVLEHAFAMVVAVMMVHIGSALARKAQEAANKHKWAAIFYTIAVLLILIAVPWTQRPLFPGL